MTFKKILVCAPTAKSKNYCFDSWLDNVMDFTYPNFEIRLFDNTNDNGKNTELLNSKYIEKYGDNDKFKAINSLVLHNLKPMESIIDKMVISHNDCRQYAIDNNFDYIFHLETDVFPEKDIIQNLLIHDKRVVGAVYYRDEGISRKPTLQRNVELATNYIGSINFDAKEDICFMNGDLKAVASVGIGATLIKTEVFKKITFRSLAKRSFHPDSYFSEDCFFHGIKIYADTSQIARHENKLWGAYGIDFT